MTQEPLQKDFDILKQLFFSSDVNLEDVKEYLHKIDIDVLDSYMNNLSVSFLEAQYDKETSNKTHYFNQVKSSKFIDYFAADIKAYEENFFLTLKKDSQLSLFKSLKPVFITMALPTLADMIFNFQAVEFKNNDESTRTEQDFATLFISAFNICNKRNDTNILDETFSINNYYDNLAWGSSDKEILLIATKQAQQFSELAASDGSRISNNTDNSISTGTDSEDSDKFVASNLDNISNSNSDSERTDLDKMSNSTTVAEDIKTPQSNLDNTSNSTTVAEDIKTPQSNLDNTSNSTTVAEDIKTPQSKNILKYIIVPSLLITTASAVAAILVAALVITLPISTPLLVAISFAAATISMAYYKASNTDNLSNKDKEDSILFISTGDLKSSEILDSRKNVDVVSYEDKSSTETANDTEELPKVNKGEVTYEGGTLHDSQKSSEEEDEFYDSQESSEEEEEFHDTMPPPS